jgi:hypothetical protein
MQTPTGLKYFTPSGHARAPTPQFPSSSTNQQWTPLLNSSTPFPNYLPLLWQGNRVEDIVKIIGEANEYEQSLDIVTAERKYREALSGYERLLSPTHDKTLQLAYQFAEFYAKQDRMLQADEVLDWMNRKIVHQWGLSHQKSNAHFFRVSNMYRRWARDEDARVLIQRLTETLSRPSTITSVTSLIESPMPSIQSLLTHGRSSTVNSTTAKSTVEQTLKLLEAQLLDTYSGVDPSVLKAQLLDLMETCEQNLEKLHTQLLKAAAILVQVSQSVDEEPEAKALREDASAACLSVLQDHEGPIDLSTVEAIVNVASNLVTIADDHSHRTTERVLERLYSRAEEDFAADPRESVVTLLQIARMYASNDAWDTARLWLQHAMSNSISLYCSHHSFVKNLETILKASTAHSAEGMIRKTLEDLTNMRFSIPRCSCRNFARY